MASATGNSFEWDHSFSIPRFFCSHWTTHKHVPFEYSIYTVTWSTECYQDPWGIIHFVGGYHA